MSLSATVFIPLIGFGLSIILLIYVIVYRKIVRDVPHPPLWPPHNGHLFLNNTPPGILLLLKDLLQKYGKRFQVALGLDVIFFTTDAKDFEVCCPTYNVIKVNV